MSDFRKKIFRGAKIEDLIIDLERLEKEFEQTISSTKDIDRKRFYEGMAIAFKIIAMKLKGEFEYLEEEFLEKVYESVKVIDQNKIAMENTTNTASKGRCSFCLQKKEPLVLGPLVSICGDCLKFGAEVLSNKTN
jgi:AAA15 family ATPase/GTPase